LPIGEGDSQLKRCLDGSYIEAGQDCGAPSYSGEYIKIAGCTRDKILKKGKDCELPEGFEFKQNGGIGVLNDGYSPYIENQENHCEERCVDITETSVTCDGKKYLSSTRDGSEFSRKLIEKIDPFQNPVPNNSGRSVLD